MPELPEVITITRDLKKELIGKKIVKVKNFKNYPLKPSRKHFSEYIEGYTIKNIEHIAKLITIEVTSGYYLVIHLGMTGNLLYNLKDDYIKTMLEFSDKTKLYFSDVRKFGYFIVWGKEKIELYSKTHSNTILSPNLNAEIFANLLLKRSGYIRDILLNQQIISGIGNIYANDGLFLSKIHPKEKANSLNKQQYEELYRNLVQIIIEGVKNRGSSIDRYKDIYGKEGKQQNFFRVYQKKNTPCTLCGSLIHYERVNGRGTFFCPSCQEINPVS